MATAATVSRPTRRVTRYILIALVLAALAVVAWKLNYIFTLVIGGVIGSVTLRVLAQPLVKWTRWPEPRCVLLVMLILVVLAGGFGWLFGVQVANEAEEMRRLIPEVVHKLADSLDGSLLGQAIKNQLRQASGDSKTLTSVGVAAGTVLAAVADTLLIIFLSIYFALSPREYLDGLLRLLPPGQRRRVETALLDAGGALRKWLVAQLIAMGAIGVLVGGVLAIMGVPLAMLLGGVALILEFIPVVVPVLFSIPGILVAFTKGPMTAFYVMLAYVAVQQIESNLIIPLLQRWAVRLPPALTLLSVLIGWLLLGPAGVVIATPLAVMVK